MLFKVEDFGRNQQLRCYLAMAFNTIVLLDFDSQDVAFVVPCRAVIGWTSGVNRSDIFTYMYIYLATCTSHMNSFNAAPYTATYARLIHERPVGGGDLGTSPPPPPGLGWVSLRLLEGGKF